MNPWRPAQILAGLLLVGGLVALTTVAISGPVSLSLGSPSGGGSQMTFGLYVDLLSAVLVTFIATIVLIVATYCRRNLRGQERQTRFAVLLSASALALALMVTAASLPLIALGWTLSGLTIAALVAHRTEPEAARAAKVVRRRLLAGDLLLWSGVLAAWFALPDLDRADLASSVTPGVAVVVIAGLLAGAAVVRSALLPAWAWLPLTAHAPSPVSAYLHAGIVNGAGVLVTLAWPIFFAAPQVLAALLVVGAVTAAVATVAAKARPDVKGQLAGSTSAQMGYMAVQLGLGLPAAAVLHLIGHGYYKAWLFLRAGGAVSRRRTTDLSSPGAGVRGLIGLPLALLAVGATIAAVSPQIGATLIALGPAAALPVIAAGATATVAVYSLFVRRNRSGRMASVLVAGLTLALLAVYLLVLAWWDDAVSSALPEVPVWSATAAIAWLVFLLVVAGLTVLAARRVVRHPEGRLGVAALGTALPVRSISAASTTAVAPPAVERPSGVEVAELARHAAATVGPAYPLRSLVAANPLAGMEGLPFIDAARIAARVRGARVFLPESQYAELMSRGQISRQDLAQVLAGQFGEERSVEAVIDEILLEAHAEPTPESDIVRTLAERRPTGSGPWSGAEVARLHDALWTAHVWGDTAVPAADGNLYGRWRTAVDHGWGRGIGVPAAAADLSDSPAAALADLLTRSAIPTSEWFEYLCRLLSLAPGWAGHAVWRTENGHDDAIVELLAIRAAHDLAVGGPAEAEMPIGLFPPSPVVALADPLVRQRIWQESLEEHYRSGLVGDVQAAALGRPEPRNCAQAPLAQVIMCIDVRSERFRRHLEAAADVRTYGFAGFFGAAVRVVNDFGQSFDQCPVLLTPTHQIHTSPGSAGSLPHAGRRAARRAWSTPTTGFALAESAGIVAGVAAATQTFAPGLTRSQRSTPDAAITRPDGDVHPADGLPLGYTTHELADLAQGALHAIGLERDFAPVIVLAGHGATVTNNAFAAAYDCGACGGNAGIENARILAHALNDSEVRAELQRRGITVPSSTIAVAALHDTTTDDFHLDRPAGLPTSEHLDRLERATRAAGAAAAAERMARLPGAPTNGSAAKRHLRRRAGDWAEACPEWGLAGNAAFVIGPRDLTAHLDLGGRVFLHSYDPDADHDSSVLQTILTAPVVVAQWINAQYYMSCVDAQHFGAGDKSTHNVIGDVGVITGAHGDLRTGLPWQALFAAEAQAPTGVGAHVPLRLSVVAYADHEAITAVVTGNETLSRLVTNEWISVTAIDPTTAEVRRLRPDLEWLSPEVPAEQEPIAVV